jgi:hypothetical protein
MIKKQRQILLAALPFLWMVCDKLLPPGGGNGELVPVKIRAMQIAEGAQNETGTRANGGGEKRLRQAIEARLPSKVAPFSTKSCTLFGDDVDLFLFL